MKSVNSFEVTGFVVNDAKVNKNVNINGADVAVVTKKEDEK